MLLFLEALSVLCKVCLTVKQRLLLFCFSQAIIFYFLFFFRMSLIIWKWSEAFLAANPTQQNTFRTFLRTSGELADNLGFSSILMQGMSAGVHSFGPLPFILISEKVVFALWENVFVNWPYKTFQVKCYFTFLVSLFPVCGKRGMLSERHFTVFSYFIKYSLGRYCLFAASACQRSPV